MLCLWIAHILWKWASLILFWLGWCFYHWNHITSHFQQHRKDPLTSFPLVHGFCVPGLIKEESTQCSHWRLSRCDEKINFCVSGWTHAGSRREGRGVWDWRALRSVVSAGLSLTCTELPLSSQETLHPKLSSRGWREIVFPTEWGNFWWVSERGGWLDSQVPSESLPYCLQRPIKAYFKSSSGCLDAIKISFHHIFFSFLVI